MLTLSSTSRYELSFTLKTHSQNQSELSKWLLHISPICFGGHLPGAEYRTSQALPIHQEKGRKYTGIGSLLLKTLGIFTNSGLAWNNLLEVKRVFL